MLHMAQLGQAYRKRGDERHAPLLPSTVLQASYQLKGQQA